MTVAPLESRKIEMNSNMENIVEVENLINEIFEEYELSPDYFGNMLVALTEAVNNAIIHGNRLDDDKNVNLSFNHYGNEYKFIVIDEGEGFDFNNVPDPTSPENIEKPDGRGIFLMKNLANEVNYFDSGSRVELVFKAY